MLQKLPVNNFQWIKGTCQFNEDLIKIYNEESDKEYFFEVDVQYLEKLHKFMIIYHFYLKERRLKKSQSL